jgi:hypothetical protein
METTLTRPPLNAMRRPPAPAPTAPAPATRAGVSFGKIATRQHGHRVVVYGPGGIGKTTLCASLPGPVAFIDLEGSLAPLRTNLEEQGLIENITPVDGVDNWSQMRGALNSSGWDSIKTIVIDSATKAEELCIAHTLDSIKTEKGLTPKSVEDYGYGKGFTHVFETFLPLLQDLDRHSREGRNVVLICHDCTSNVPNPNGEDWLRYEPRLQSPASGKASIRLRVREWADHVLFIGYDVAVSKDGKGMGAGTKTLYTSELPHCMAKSRSISDAIPLDGGEFWSRIIR